MRNIENTNLVENKMSDDVNENFVQNTVSRRQTFIRKVPQGPIPPDYLCHKCHISGHWVHQCPGVVDKAGNFIDYRRIKRPTGIPTTKLIEVDPNTPNCYLTKDGRYVINIMDHVALNRNDTFLKGMQNKLPSILKPASLICGICSKILQSPVNTPCCDKTYCNKCVLNTIFFEKKDTFHTCPNCKSIIDSQESFTADLFLKDIIREWNSKKLTEKDIERMLLTRERKVKKKKSSKNVNVVDDDDLTDDIFGLSKVDDQLMLTAENYLSRKQDEEQSVTGNYYDMTQQTVAVQYQPISVLENGVPNVEMNYQNFDYVDTSQKIGVLDSAAISGFNDRSFSMPYIYNASQNQMIHNQFGQLGHNFLPQVSNPQHYAIEMKKSRRLREQEEEFLKKTMEKSLPQGRNEIRSHYEVFEPATVHKPRSKSPYPAIRTEKDKRHEDIHRKNSVRKRSQSRSNYYHEKAIVNKRQDEMKLIPVDWHRSEYGDASKGRDRRNRSRSKSPYYIGISRNESRQERDFYGGGNRKRSHSSGSHSHKGKVNRKERAYDHNSGRYHQDRSIRAYYKKKSSHNDGRNESYGDREKKSDNFDSKYQSNSYHSRSSERKSMNRNDKQRYHY